MAHTIDAFLSRLHLDDQASQRRDPSGARGEHLRTHIRAPLRTRFMALSDRVAKIRADPALTEAGKAQQIADLGKKTDVSFLTAARDEAQETVERLRTMLFAIPKSEREPILAFLHEQAVRDAYKDAAPHMRMEAYRKSIQDGQHEIARALTSGPLGSLVPVDYQQEVLQAHAEKAQPLVYENYQQAQTMLEHVTSLHDHATQVLQGLKDETPARAVA